MLIAVDCELIYAFNGREMEHLLDFDINNCHDQKFLEFIRHSTNIRHLFEEELFESSRPNNLYHVDSLSRTLGSFFHMTGAIGYVVLVTMGVLLHDLNEPAVAWVTGAFFLAFSLLGYLTGIYLPVIRPLRGYILLWNPFVRDPHFMANLKQVTRYTISSVGRLISITLHLLSKNYFVGNCFVGDTCIREKEG